MYVGERVGGGEGVHKERYTSAHGGEVVGRLAQGVGHVCVRARSARALATQSGTA